MKSGFCSRGVRIFDGCERLRVPTKSGWVFFWFFLSPRSGSAKTSSREGGKLGMSRIIRSFVSLGGRKMRNVSHNSLVCAS